jgi:hypothetical protein
MHKEMSLAIIAIVAAIGLLGIVVIKSINLPLQQQADARGCRNSIAVNASQGRCIH